MEQITQQVTFEAIGVRAGELIRLQALAVADPSSRGAVGHLATSGMGKTTLAALLGRQWSYVTDETAAIDQDGFLAAYPKPLSVIPSHGPTESKDQVSPAELALRPLPTAHELRVAQVLLLDRAAGSEVTLDAIPTVPAVALLAEHTSYLAQMHHPLAGLAQLLHRTGGLQRVRYGEAADVVPVVEELLGGSS